MGTTRVAIAIAIVALTGCSGLPRLDLQGDINAAAPVGPKVASLVANLKCELWNAANSELPLDFYKDQPSLPKRKNDGGTRAFTLHNIFTEVEYVGEATFTLDVIQTGAFNPSVSVTNWLGPAAGKFPATSQVLAVGGQYSEAAHRYITLETSVDFARLVGSPRDPRYRGPGTEPSPAAAPAPCDGKGGELKGSLGMTETLATGLIEAAMTDISVFPRDEAKVDGNTPLPKSAPVQLPTTYSFGQISGQVDFTIIEDVNGGPNFIYKFVTFPGTGGSNGLLNFQRQVKDTLVVTFVPVCIRQRYYTKSTKQVPFEYTSLAEPPLEQPMVEGTPGWANYLLPCDTPLHAQLKAEAASKGSARNQQVQLLNSLTQPQR